MTQEELFEIEMRMKRASPGPCGVQRLDHDNGEITYQVQCEGKDSLYAGRVLGSHCDYDNPNAKNDAEFEAKVREDLVKVINYAKELKAALYTIFLNRPASNVSAAYLELYVNDLCQMIINTMKDPNATPDSIFKDLIK